MKNSRYDKPKFSDKKMNKFGGPKPATELFEAVCANCGMKCEVPFKPNGKKPILCRPCFKKSEESTTRTQAQYNKPHYPAELYKKDLEQINHKLDRILRMLEK